MAAVAIVKNPNWATSKQIGGPKMIDKKWVINSENKRKVFIWNILKRQKLLQISMPQCHIDILFTILLPLPCLRYPGFDYLLA